MSSAPRRLKKKATFDVSPADSVKATFQELTTVSATERKDKEIDQPPNLKRQRSKFEELVDTATNILSNGGENTSSLPQREDIYSFSRNPPPEYLGVPRNPPRGTRSTPAGQFKLIYHPTVDATKYLEFGPPPHATSYDDNNETRPHGVSFEDNNELQDEEEINVDSGFDDNDLLKEEQFFYEPSPETPKKVKRPYNTRKRLPLGVRKSRNNQAGSKYPPLTPEVTQEYLDTTMSQNAQRHYMHFCANELARKAFQDRLHAPPVVRHWLEQFFGDYWRLFLGFDPVTGQSEYPVLDDGMVISGGDYRPGSGSPDEDGLEALDANGNSSEVVIDQ